MAERIPGRTLVNPGRANNNGSAPQVHIPGAEPNRSWMTMYEQIYSWENLLTAFRKAAKGKRGHVNVAAFEYHLEDNLLALQADLRSLTYQPGQYDSFYIHEPKKRLISAAPFRDRVVPHALCNLIEPLFERGFSSASFANRKRKGTHKTLDQAQRCARRYPFVLQCNVRQFFPSIDHAILQAQLVRKIADTHVLWLCEQILNSRRGVLAEEYEMVYFSGDDLLAASRQSRAPIGILTNQFWANVTLSGFDHFIQRQPGCQATRVTSTILCCSRKIKLLYGLGKRPLYNA